MATVFVCGVFFRNTFLGNWRLKEYHRYTKGEKAEGESHRVRQGKIFSEGTQ